MLIKGKSGGSGVVFRDWFFTGIVEFTSISFEELEIKEGLVDVVGCPIAILSVTRD